MNIIYNLAFKKKKIDFYFFPFDFILQKLQQELKSDTDAYPFDVVKSPSHMHWSY